MENSISLKELKTHFVDQGAHILYLLRLGIGKNGVFKSMSEMSKDIGVTDGYIRQIKHRAIHKRSYKVHRANYVEGILQMWTKGMSI